jgi:hypothetical protein
MTYLLAVAIVAEAPHAPAAYHAVERPLLLARIQGEWVYHIIDPADGRPWCDRIVIRGSLVYRYDPRPIDTPQRTVLPASVRQIKNISPTSLQTVFLNGQEAQTYSLQGDTLTEVIKKTDATIHFRRVPPGR